MTQEEIEPKYRAETCRSPLGETGDYDSWIELVTPDFNLTCYDPNVELEQIQELADKLNQAELAAAGQVNWIKCSERLPEVDPLGIIMVLVSDGRNIDTAMYRYKEFSLGVHPRLTSQIIWWQYISPIPE